VHWLTGTASTVMVGCVEGILGLRPDINGLRLSPAIPASWKSFTMEKTFRGKKLRVQIQNPQGRENGCRKLPVNGVEMADSYSPASALKADNEVMLEM
jgi:cellobiose phosphorylase